MPRVFGVQTVHAQGYDTYRLVVTGSDGALSGSVDVRYLNDSDCTYRSASFVFSSTSQAADSLVDVVDESSVCTLRVDVREDLVDGSQRGVQRLLGVVLYYDTDIVSGTYSFWLDLDFSRVSVAAGPTPTPTPTPTATPVPVAMVSSTALSVPQLGTGTSYQPRVTLPPMVSSNPFVTGVGVGEWSGLLGWMSTLDAFVRRTAPQLDMRWFTGALLFGLALVCWQWLPLSAGPWRLLVMAPAYFLVVSWTPLGTSLLPHFLLSLFALFVWQGQSIWKSVVVPTAGSTARAVSAREVRGRQERLDREERGRGERLDREERGREERYGREVRGFLERAGREERAREERADRQLTIGRERARAQDARERSQRVRDRQRQLDMDRRDDARERRREAADDRRERDRIDRMQETRTYTPEGDLIRVSRTDYATSRWVPPSRRRGPGAPRRGP